METKFCDVTHYRGSKRMHLALWLYSVFARHEQAGLVYAIKEVEHSQWRASPDERLERRRKLRKGFVETHEV